MCSLHGFVTTFEHLLRLRADWILATRSLRVQDSPRHISWASWEVLQRWNEVTGSRDNAGTAAVLHVNCYTCPCGQRPTDFFFLKTCHSSEVSCSETRHSSEVSCPKTRHSDEVSCSETRHSSEVSCSETRHSSEVSSSETRHSSELSCSETRHSSELSCSETLHSSEVSCSETGHSSELSCPKTRHSSEVNRSKTCHHSSLVTYSKTSPIIKKN